MTMPFQQLELAYEALAEAIDAAGPEREALLLTKLALALAHEAGDLEMFRRCLAMALQDVGPAGAAASPEPAPTAARQV